MITHSAKGSLNHILKQIMLMMKSRYIVFTKIYEINLDHCPTNQKDNYNNNSLATRNPKHLDGIFKLVKKIADNRKPLFAQEWERLKNEQKTTLIFQIIRISGKFGNHS